MTLKTVVKVNSNDILNILFLVTFLLKLHDIFEIKFFVDMDKTKACAVKLYGNTSYGIMCVDPVRAIGKLIFLGLIYLPF